MFFNRRQSRLTFPLHESKRGSLEGLKDKIDKKDIDIQTWVDKEQEKCSMWIKISVVSAAVSQALKQIRYLLQ